MERTMKAKLRVVQVIDQRKNGFDNIEVNFMAVGPSGSYPEDGTDENNSYARWTPTADMHMVINNPNLMDKFEVGQEYYVDFTLSQADPAEVEGS